MIRLCALFSKTFSDKHNFLVKKSFKLGIKNIEPVNIILTKKVFIHANDLEL